MQKLIFSILSIFIFVSCGSLQRHSQEKTKQVNDQPEAEGKKLEPEEEPLPIKEPEKLGIILGPGYLKSFAHLGVLKEIEKAGLKPDYIVGMGWSSIVAGAYAMNSRVSEPEWTMFKTKEDYFAGKSLFGGDLKAIDLEKMKPYLEQVFKSNKASAAKVNFACPSTNLRTFDLSIEPRGYFKEEVAKCIAGNGFYKAERFYTWDPFSLSEILKKMRQAGIEKILVVDVVTPKDYGKKSIEWPSAMDYYIWGRSDKMLEELGRSVDYYIPVNLNSYDWQDQSKLREFVRQGQLSGKITINKMAREILGR